MIASLMMYRRPEWDDAIARFWRSIRAHLSVSGIASPPVLSQDADPMSVWLNPNLVLSQTCGMPYRLHLHEKVQLVGTPDYAVNDCPPGHYKSVLIARRTDPRKELSAFAAARFAYNQRTSQSGYAAPFTHLRPLGFWFQDRVETGAHIASARAVASGEADLAAIDAVTWRGIVALDEFASDLKIIDETAPTPGLPFITSRHLDARAVCAAVSMAIADLSDADRRLLGINGIVDIPSSVYLSIPNPDDHTALN